MSEFKNKVALITGASGAIGKDIASTLNKSGAAVILCGTKIDVLEDIASDLSGEVEIITENVKNFEKFEKSYRNHYSMIINIQMHLQVFQNYYI